MATRKQTKKGWTGNKANSEKKSDAVFASGFNIFQPRATAPNFAKGTICISLSQFITFCEEHPEYLRPHETFGDQIFLDLNESQEGVLYAKVNTYKKEK